MWLRDTNVDLYGIQGYNVEHKVRANRIGGGVSMYVESSISYKRRVDLESVMTDPTESIIIELPCKHNVTNKPIVVAEIYRPPGSSVKDFTDSLDVCLNQIAKEGKLCYIMGDLNINLLNNANHTATADFMNVMYSHMLVPLITRPTRITEYSASLIDHIYTNVSQVDQNQIISGILYCSLSDHLPVFCTQQSNAPKPKSKQCITFRLINDRTINSLKHSLTEMNWEEVLRETDMDKAYTMFHDAFTQCYDECIPKITKKIKVKLKPWMTEGIINSIKRKHKLYSAYVKNPCYVTEARYKQYRNKLNHVIRKAERMYVNESLEKCKSDFKKSWSILNDIIGKGSSKGNKLPEQVKVNGAYVNDPKEIANAFNKYFTKVGKQLSDNINSNVYAKEL